MRSVGVRRTKGESGIKEGESFNRVSKTTKISGYRKERGKKVTMGSGNQEISDV